MATLVKLVGYDLGLGDPNYKEVGNNHIVTQYTSVASGVGKEIRVFRMDESSDTIKAHLNAGNDDLLQDFGEKTLSSAGWNVFSITDEPITSSQSYFLGVFINTASTGGFDGASATGVEYYLASDYSSAVAPDPWDDTGYNVYSPYDMAIVIFGYVPPTITADNKSGSIAYDETGVVLTCTELEGTQGTGKIEISDNATYGLGTVVEQTGITAWGDTSTTFNVSPGGLSSGTVYVWATTDSGQHNVTGYSMTLTAAGGNGFNASSTMPVAISDALFGNQYENSFSANGQMPVNTGEAVFSQENSSLLSGTMPIMSSSAIFTSPGEAPICEHLVNEASSGAGTGTVIDNRSDPENLTITYGGGGSPPAYFEDGRGRGLDFGVVPQQTVGAFNGPVVSPNKIFDAIDGQRKVTFEAVYKLPTTEYGARNGGNIYTTMQYNGNGRECGIWQYEEATGPSDPISVQVSFSNPDAPDPVVDELGFYANYYNRHVNIDSYLGQTIVIHYVIDTTEVVAVDRMKVYINGVNQTLLKWLPNHGVGDPPLNTLIGLTSLSPSDPDYDVYMCLGGTKEYISSSGMVRGAVKYGAIYDRAMQASEISIRSADLTIDDDQENSGSTENDFAASSTMPAITGYASFNQSNTVIANGTMPVLVSDAEFGNLGENGFSANGTMPVLSGSAVFYQSHMWQNMESIDGVDESEIGEIDGVPKNQIGEIDGVEV